MYETTKSYEEERMLINQDLITDQYKEMQGDYDREKAVQYAREYALNRNSFYYDYDSNCVNYVSQCMYEGDLIMDYKGQYQWKYYSSLVYEYDGQRGHTYSFTYIPAFIE